MAIKVITVTNTPERAKPLLDSLAKFNWPYALLETEWKGFGTKLIATYEYLKANPEVTEFIFCDAHDVVALGSQLEFERRLENRDKMLLSAERGCWPPTMQQYEKYYEPLEPHGWNYVNSGLYYSPSKFFMDLMEQGMPKFETDDQEWMGLHFLFNDHAEISIDRPCNVFQSYSFIQENDFDYKPLTLVNRKTGTTPVFIHGNGCTDMTPIYNLLK